VAVVPQFLGEPTLHRRLDVGLGMSVAYKKTFTSIDWNAKLQGCHVYKENLFKLRTDLSPHGNSNIAAFGLIHAEDLTAALLKEDHNVLPVLKGPMTYLSVGRRRRGGLQETQYDLLKNPLIGNALKGPVNPCTVRPMGLPKRHRSDSWRDDAAYVRADGGARWDSSKLT